MAIRLYWDTVFSRPWAKLFSTGFAAITSACVATAASSEPQATAMWGTTGAGDSGSQTTDSANFHASSGTVAAQENAAREGILLSAPNMTVIGSQSIVQVTGHNNALRDISQDSSNEGDVSLTAPLD